ncbi:peptide-methionine (S)-S-oxide reductase MsrA [Cohnella sp. WQ 127256]|uniref:peptide-methionine (S)-S-oxide reductase MsrA n=1 Tax=Cohnella sp. WQ 127256 TaxID=2938790 RepID=UPI00211855D9|nr:peptide-methionine (S)-S-oxide reductase MsrA [Cohnella sp. WQ 127256]
MNNHETITHIETATLGMGCFWSPEALFGSLPGVLRTRVGYAGGTTSHPTYRKMGDHSEVVEVDFDADLISYGELLTVFWNNHNPININGYKGRQYQSLLLYRNEEQEETIHRMKKRMELDKGSLETEIVPYTEFHIAEPRHQKYYVKRFPNAIGKLSTLYPSEEELMNATLAARLNGLAKGFANLEHIQREIHQWPISTDNQAEFIQLIRQIRW